MIENKDETAFALRWLRELASVTNSDQFGIVVRAIWPERHGSIEHFGFIVNNWMTHCGVGRPNFKFPNLAELNQPLYLSRNPEEAWDLLRQMAIEGGSVIIPPDEVIVQYLVVNEHAVMSPGKLAAQAAHAETLLAVSAERQLGRVLANWEADGLTTSLREIVCWDAWIALDMRKIVLRAQRAMAERLEKEGLFSVRDAGHTELEPLTLTVLALPPMPKSEVPKHIRRLRLF